MELLGDECIEMEANGMWEWDVTRQGCCWFHSVDTVRIGLDGLGIVVCCRDAGE